MKKHITILATAAIISLFGSFFYFIITSTGVHYSPGISEEEMAQMSYSEVAELMGERSRKASVFEIISMSISNPIFLFGLIKLWIVLFIAIIGSHFLLEKLLKEQKENKFY